MGPESSPGIARDIEITYLSQKVERRLERNSNHFGSEFSRRDWPQLVSKAANTDSNQASTTRTRDIDWR